MTTDETLAQLAAFRMQIEAEIGVKEAQIFQIDALMRGLSPKVAAEKCPVCAAEDLANADTHGGRARVCKLCGHAFELAPIPEETSHEV